MTPEEAYKEGPKTLTSGNRRTETAGPRPKEKLAILASATPATPLRRIREAEETGAVDLELANLSELTQLPPELARLTSLQLLIIFGCTRLSFDLAALASFTSLQSLNLSVCHQLSGDLTPLAGLTSLEELHLFACGLTGDLTPLADLTSLQSLNLCEHLSGDLSPLARCPSWAGHLSPALDS